MSIINKVKDWVNNQSQLTADKCRSYQSKSINKDFEQRLSNKVSEINQRIEFVVTNSNEESTVIYSFNTIGDLFESVKNYYLNLGYKVTEIQVPELGNKSYVIISWN